MKQEHGAAQPSFDRRPLALAFLAFLGLLLWGIFATTTRSDPTPRGPAQAPVKQVPVERVTPGGEAQPAC